MYPLPQTVKVRGLEDTTLANYELRRETFLLRRQDPAILIPLRLKMQIAAGVNVSTITYPSFLLCPFPFLAVQDGI